MGTEATIERVPLVSSSTPAGGMFLVSAELQALTGYRSNSKQIQWLLSRGWIHEVSSVGRPIVARSYCEKRLGFVADSERSWSPDLSVFRGS